MLTASNFLEQVIEQYPFKITKLLTDNGIEFCYNALVKEKKPKDKIHLFIAICNKYNTEHRCTKPFNPQTNGMVKKVNDIIKSKTLGV